MPGRETPRILIADNDEEVLIALEHILETGGYATATALCPQEAAKLLGQARFDLCVIDDCFSDKDCISALTEFKTRRTMPLVIVTYHQFPVHEQETQLRALGVSAFVNKRAHTELVEIVAELLQPVRWKSRDPLHEIT